MGSRSSDFVVSQVLITRLPDKGRSLPDKRFATTFSEEPPNLIEKPSPTNSCGEWRLLRKSARKCYDDSSCLLPVGAAIPKKTRTARFSRTISSSARWPTSAPIFVFGTVVTLSTIKRQTARSPLLSLGLMRIRKRGASVGSVVNPHTVMESVLLKRSSWRITTGRGFPE